MLNLFTVTVNDTLDLHTDTLFSLHAMLAIVRHDMFIIACATFNTCIWAFLDDLVPRMEVVARFWTGADAWIVRSAAVALHWAHFLCSPVDVNTMSVAFLSIGADGSTKTFTVPTRVASACVEDTIVVVHSWVNV